MRDTHFEAYLFSYLQNTMLRFYGRRLLVLTTLELLLLSIPYLHALREVKIKTKSAVFHSPKFELKPGSVVDKYYYNIDFPSGHIGLKEFDAEVVDESGNPIPLHQTYLHHWVVMRYFHLKNSSKVGSKEHDKLEFKLARNSGVCQRNMLGQYFGLGSETRRTSTYVPDPYGIEIGNTAEIPEGYEEKWMLNVHAIDTRGVEDRLGCTECRCDLYNVTKDAHGRPLRPEYKGGLYCCYDGTQCRVKEGVQSVKRSLYLRYTVKWVDWNDFILPARIYIFDVTDTWKPLNDSSLQSSEHDCKVTELIILYSICGVVNFLIFFCLLFFFSYI